MSKGVYRWAQRESEAVERADDERTDAEVLDQRRLVGERLITEHRWQHFAVIVGSGAYRDGNRIAECEGPSSPSASREFAACRHVDGDFVWLGLFDPSRRELAARRLRRSTSTHSRSRTPSSPTSDRRSTCSATR